MYSKAFEEVIPLTGPYASLLGKVKVEIVGCSVMQFYSCSSESIPGV